MTITLSVYTKLNDDMLQIVEQIVPYFQPGYTLPIKFLGNFNEVRNVPLSWTTLTCRMNMRGTLIQDAAYSTHLHSPSRLWSSDLSRMSLAISSRRFLSVTFAVLKMVVGMKETLHISPHQEPIKDYDGVVANVVTENVDMTETVIDVDNGSCAH